MIKAIYFADCMGDIERERDIIVSFLKQQDIELEIEATEISPFKNYYDVLFFDWGGMSFGNSMLEHFCEYIHEYAKEYPSRVYVMCSSFTEHAMQEVLERSDEIPPNVFFRLEDINTVDAIKDIIKEKGGDKSSK